MLLRSTRVKLILFVIIALVGVSYVGAVCADKAVVREYRWQGDRASNRRASVLAVLRLALELVG